MSNTWTIYLYEGDNRGKPWLIPHETTSLHEDEVKVPQGTLREESTAYQLVGEVMAYQGNDG